MGIILEIIEKKMFTFMWAKSNHNEDEKQNNKRTFEEDSGESSYGQQCCQYDHISRKAATSIYQLQRILTLQKHFFQFCQEMYESYENIASIPAVPPSPFFFPMTHKIEHFVSVSDV